MNPPKKNTHPEKDPYLTVKGAYSAFGFAVGVCFLDPFYFRSLLNR